MQPKDVQRRGIKIVQNQIWKKQVSAIRKKCKAKAWNFDLDEEMANDFFHIILAPATGG